MMKPEHLIYIDNRNKKLRMAAAKKTLWVFARSYLGHIFNLRPSKMHVEFSAMLEDMTINRGRKLAVTGPYQYLQCELLSLAYVLWCICFEKEKFILLVADNTDHARDALFAIKHEIINNKKIRTDFPHVAGRNPGHWNALNTITRNGVNIRGAGLNQKHLSFRFKNTHPSLIIFHLPDDHNMDFHRTNPAKWQKWFDIQIERNTFYNTNMIAAGTFAPTPNSLLAKLFTDPNYNNWKNKRYSAIISESNNIRICKRWERIYNGRANYYYTSGPETADKFFKDHKDKILCVANVLWPEYESYCKLMKMRILMGPKDFSHFKQNQIHHRMSKIQKVAIGMARSQAYEYGISSLYIPDDWTGGSIPLLEANGIRVTTEELLGI